MVGRRSGNDRWTLYRRLRFLFILRARCGPGGGIRKKEMAVGLVKKGVASKERGYKEESTVKKGKVTIERGC